MSDRDDLLNKIARVLHNNPPEDRPLTPDDCTVCDQALRQAAAVLAVLPSGDGPLREALRELANDLDFLEATPPGSYPEATAYASGQESGWLIAADKIRALLDGAS